MPVPQMFMSVGVFGDDILLVHGRFEYEPMTSHFVYNVTSETWSTSVSPSLDAYGRASVVQGDFLYLFGGRFIYNPPDGFLYSATHVDYFDTGDSEWAEGDHLPLGTAYGAAWEVEGDFFFAGGSTGDDEALAKGYRWLASTDGTWSDADMTDLPEVLTSPAYTRSFSDADGHYRLWVVGGRDGSTRSDDVYYYSVNGDTWHSSDGLYTGASEMGAVCLDGYVYAGGGSTAGGVPSDWFGRIAVDACDGVPGTTTTSVPTTTSTTSTTAADDDDADDDTDDDDDADDDGCIVCQSNPECYDYLGDGWLCVDYCCEEFSDDDDDASDDDTAPGADDDDAATGGDDDDDGGGCGC
ncbi:MAG: hypothetical protein M5R36_24560 [Deltaproteobacteria bacterium]|nr:hypothetical protein [Deltaproteobacteria bacterium]